MSATNEAPVLPGCEAMSRTAGAEVGVVVVHGFTGTPGSVRGVADAVVAAGHDVELPRLPGHGTCVDDMLATGWSDWVGEVGRVVDSISARVEHVVVVGQSMGATLALAVALERSDVAALVCINPLTRTRDDETMEMIEDLIDDGFDVVPGEGSDIADPAGRDLSYDGTPLRPLVSLLREGVAPITGRFGELSVPLRLFTSRQDHVVDPADSEHLAATYGGLVEHTWLERSFHVATLDHDRQLVETETVDFVARCASRWAGR